MLYTWYNCPKKQKKVFKGLIDQHSFRNDRVSGLIKSGKRKTISILCPFISITYNLVERIFCYCHFNDVGKNRFFF